MKFQNTECLTAYAHFNRKMNGSHDPLVLYWNQCCTGECYNGSTVYKEFQSACTLLDHSFSFCWPIYLKKWPHSFTKKAQLLPHTYRIHLYIYLKMLFLLGPTEKKKLILQWILLDLTYYTFNTINWQNIFSKTNVCVCFTEIKHKTIFWNKAHYTNEKIYHMEANKCM